MKTSIISQEKARKELSDKIKELLIADIRFRDNDVLLANRIQRDEITKHAKINEMSINDFFMMRSDGKVSSEFDIVCLRIELQEKFPETRMPEVIEKEEGTPVVVEEYCEHCQGTKMYEAYPCNMCAIEGPFK